MSYHLNVEMIPYIWIDSQILLISGPNWCLKLRSICIFVDILCNKKLVDFHFYQKLNFKCTIFLTEFTWYLTTVYWDLDWLYVFIDLIWSKCTHFVYVTSPSNHDGNDDVVRCINLLSMIGDLKLCTSFIVSLGTNARFVVCVCVQWSLFVDMYWNAYTAQIAICWEPKQLENNKEKEWEKKYNRHTRT